MKKLILLLGFAVCGFAQTYNLGVVYTTSTPSGACTLRSTLVWVEPSGDLYGCDGGTYALVASGGGGGGGTVTSVGFSTNLGTAGGTPVTGSGTLTLSVSASDIVGKFSGCSGTDYLGADGACHAPAGGGTVTSIATTSPISGGTITTTGTISCPTCVTTSNTGVWTVATNDIYNSNSGNVGIGGAPGNYKLDVSKSGSSGTVRFFDQTATTGITNVLFQCGAGQCGDGSKILSSWTNTTGGFATININGDGSFGIYSNSDTFRKQFLYQNLFAQSSDSLHEWKSSTDVDSGSVDLGIGRNAAGVLEVNNGTLGTYRDLKLRNSTYTGYSDLTAIAAPSNPSAGSIRVYADSGTGNLTCLTSAGGNCLPGSGTVTTTGSPANGNLTKFSGAASITNGDLSGDVTTSGTLAATVAKVNGVSYSAAPSTHTTPIITASNTATYTSINDCTGAGKALTFAQSGDTFGCNTITGGTSTHYLYYRAASDDGASAGRARTDMSGCSVNSLTMLTTAAFSGGIGEGPNAGCTTVHVFRLPSTWDGNSPTFVVDALVGTTSTSVFTLTPVSQCYTPGTDAYASGSNNTGTGVNTTPTGTAFVALSVTLTIPITNCAAGDVMVFGFTRSNSDAFTTSVFWTGGTLTIVY